MKKIEISFMLLMSTIGLSASLQCSSDIEQERIKLNTILQSAITPTELETWKSLELQIDNLNKLISSSKSHIDNESDLMQKDYNSGNNDSANARQAEIFRLQKILKESRSAVNRLYSKKESLEDRFNKRPGVADQLRQLRLIEDRFNERPGVADQLR